jgi:hypothetical protein
MATYNNSNLDAFTNLDNQNYHYGTRPDFPVAEQNQTYFAYWDGIGGTGAEIPNNTAYFIKYIIDTEGNVVNPEPKTAGSPRDEAIGLYNLLDNFEVGKRAIIKLIEPDPTQQDISEESDLLGTYTITGIGTLRNIMTTETGKTPNDYLETMSFYYPKNPDVALATVPFYNARYKWASSYILTKAIEHSASYVEPVWQTGWSNTLITPPANPPHIYPYRYIQPITSSIDVGTRIRFTLLIWLSQIDYAVPAGIPAGSYNSSAAENNSIQFRIRNNTTGQSIFTSPWITPSTTDEYNPSGYWLETGWVNVNTTDTFVVTSQLSNNASGSNASYRPIRIDNDSLFSVEQEYYPNTEVEGFNTAYSPYFSRCVNYAGYSRLTFSEALENIFPTDYAQLVTPDQQLLGFSPSNIPFNEIGVGDYIRFEYNPDMVYRIIGLSARSGSGDIGVYSLKMDIAPSLDLTLEGTNSSVSSSININHFTIYRIENDGRYIILNVPKTSKGNAYSGIIQSEFSSKELITKYDKIIADLSQKEIIQ